MGSRKPGLRPSGELLEAVSNLVVRIYADHVGRGPTKARAYADRDIIVCVMEDTMTVAEKTLVDSGQADVALRVRRALQEVMREELATGIEELTGRRVVAQTGTGTLKPDVKSDLFILEDDGVPANGHRPTNGRGPGNGASPQRRAA